MSLDIEKLQKLCEVARYAFGDTAIIAGGAVRDCLHGRPVKDIDIFVRESASAESREAAVRGFREDCANFAYELGTLNDGPIAMNQQDRDKASGGDLVDVVEFTGGEYPAQVMLLPGDPVNDVQSYDFALSQCFVTPQGLFYTETYLGDANGLTVTYRGTADTGSAAFMRSVRRLARLRAKYAPEFTFQNCELLDKVASDSML